MESDWKKFTAMLSVWRERYLADRNARFVRILTNQNKTETERFWETEELMRKEAKTLQRCLDDIRRSRMWDQLMAMRAAGMIKREDLADFSPELQRQVFDLFPEA